VRIKLKYKNGQVIYKYSLKTKIGEGAFGSVWLATDLALNSEVAVKLLDQTEFSLDERLFEAQIGNRLKHPNVISLNGADIATIDGNSIVIISMPYYSNGSIVSQANKRNFINLKNAIKCVIDILCGLEYLHENGYYHCDIKPNNILIGDRGEYILSDYGIACHSSNFGGVEPTDVYHPHIAPEIISDFRHDRRTDIYQTGITAFRLINGLSLIKDEFLINIQAFERDVSQGRIITDAKYQWFVPRSIKRVINKAVDPNPDKRYQTALEMRRSLEKIYLIGDCTTDEEGNLIVFNDHYSYVHSITKKYNGCFDLDVYKISSNTKRETRCSKYCLSNLHNKELKANLQRFFQEIIRG